MQSLPQNSSIIHCIRAYQCYRIVIGLRCMTDRRFKYLAEVIKNYEKYCSVCELRFLNHDFSTNLKLIYCDLRKCRRNTEKISTSSNNTMYLTLSQIYNERGPRTICPHVQEKDFNKRPPKHTSRQIKRKLRNRYAHYSPYII